MNGYAAVVLAAGRATRYRAAGGSEPTKILALLDGQPMLRRVALEALRSCAAPVILVTGHAAEPVRHAVADLPLLLAHNPAYADGLAGSLRQGLDAVPASCAGALVLLADMPGVSSETLDALAACADAQADVDAVVPVRDGRRGNPVLLMRRIFAAATALTGDTGARHLLRDAHLRVAELPVTDAGVLHDLDLPAHLHGSRDPAG